MHGVTDPPTREEFEDVEYSLLAQGARSLHRPCEGTAIGYPKPKGKKGAPSTAHTCSCGRQHRFNIPVGMRGKLATVCVTCDAVHLMPRFGKAFA